MQTLLWTKKIIFIGFIHLATSFTVQAEIVDKSIQKEVNKPELEVKLSLNTPTIDSNDNIISIPKLKSVQHNIELDSELSSNQDSSLNIDTVTQERKSSKTSPFKPYITKAENKYIPVMADAIIFANYDEELPAIVNYYTYASEEEIITFYKSTFNKSVKQERKRGRLTLNYKKNDKPVTVIISQQDNKYQVDVMMTSP